MGVYRCTRPDGSFDNLEVPAACLADLHAALMAGPVLGSVLQTVRSDTHGERIVTARRGVIVAAGAYTRIEGCSVRFVEAE